MAYLLLCLIATAFLKLTSLSLFRRGTLMTDDSDRQEIVINDSTEGLSSRKFLTISCVLRYKTTQFSSSPDKAKPFERGGRKVTGLICRSVRWPNCRKIVLGRFGFFIAGRNMMVVGQPVSLQEEARGFATLPMQGRRRRAKGSAQ